MTHQIVKPQVLANAAVGFLENEVVIPNTFTKKGIDQFKGVENDTINHKVPGVLPFHDYAWRNDRSAPIQLDEYSERKIAVSFGGNVYSAVQVTDEQNDFDLKSWTDLLEPQTRAVGRGLENRAVKKLEDAPYNVTIGGVKGALRSALIEARKVLNKFNVPDEQRLLVVGSDFEAELLNDKELNLASNVGEGIAVSALTNATIGRRFGFDIIVSQEIAPDAAYAYVKSGFVFLTGAPSVPQSVGYGATASHNGIALRWVRDYDPGFMRERSVVNTYAGFDYVKDPLRYVLKSGASAGNEKVTDTEFFVRGVKLTLGGVSAYPAKTGATKELYEATGVSTDTAWVNPATPAGGGA